MVQGSSEKVTVFFRYFLTFFLVVTLNFVIPRAMPGDPVVNLFGEEAYLHPEILQEIRKEFGLDKPLIEQYFLYIENLFTGNFGYSFSFHKPVLEVISEYMWRTILLTLPSTVVGVLFGVYVGSLIAWKKKQVEVVLMIVVYSIPVYWLGIIFLYFFSYKAGIFPLGGAISSFEDVNKLILPSTTIVLHLIAINALMSRAIVSGTMNESFIVTAIAKGLKGETVLRRHVIRASLAPIIAMSAIEFGFAFSGSILVEIVFSYPGIGLLIWEAVRVRDYPILQAIFILVAIIVISANAIADLISKAIDPRLRS
ncbi:MAG: ABC transporter permease [Archaeoglobaceae archaeon]|nr:ABC transporter permease [Archaeoglobaceae archaeon]MCX8152732.1 ABC transporter permease [Archaeoglobaceae archaeon]MDW8013439.1 ABC transporter permease [Archaeoglobaceae archaeon]